MLNINNIIFKMSNKSNKKQNTQPSSLAALSHSSEHSEATKKAISTEQIQFQNFASEFEKQSSHFHINVPFEVNIKSLTKHLRMKVAEKQQFILLYSDQKLGQILLQQRPMDNCWFRFLDCLCICRKEGWPKKAINQLYEAVSITIKREFVEQRCTIGIKSNFSRQNSSVRHKQFMEQLILFIKKCLQTFKDLREYHEIKEVEAESPLWFQMNAFKSLQGILNQGNQDKRLKTLFDTSLAKMRTTLQEFQKQNPPKVSEILQKVINQTNSIFNSLCNTPGIGQLGLQHDYTLYGIQSFYCYHFLQKIFTLYRKGTEKHCEQFQNNSKYINVNLTNSQYFDFLEVRNKFRLPKSQNPYKLAIASLRKIQNAISLREMLQCIQETFSLIKIQCLTEHKGKLQISSMDDILPVMIFVVAKAQITDFPVYVKLIDDYIRIRGVFELEQRVITTLYVATEDICKKVPPIPEK